VHVQWYGPIEEWHSILAVRAAACSLVLVLVLVLVHVLVLVLVLVHVLLMRVSTWVHAAACLLGMVRVVSLLMCAVTCSVVGCVMGGVATACLFVCALLAVLLVASLMVRLLLVVLRLVCAVASTQPIHSTCSDRNHHSVHVNEWKEAKAWCSNRRNGGPGSRQLF
jgi:hypothetical protein